MAKKIYLRLEDIILRQLPGQEKSLINEGVEIIVGKVDLNKFGWNTSGLYMQKLV